MSIDNYLPQKDGPSNLVMVNTPSISALSAMLVRVISTSIKPKRSFSARSVTSGVISLSLKKRLGDLPPISHISHFSKSPAPTKTIDQAVVENTTRVS